MDRDVAELARWWSWRRQRLDRSCRDVADALASVVGVYGSNPSGPLSLLARVPRLSAAAVDSVVLARRAVRVPAMRRSVYLLPASTAHFAFRATFNFSPYKWLLSRAKIPEGNYEGLKRRILERTAAPKTAAEIRASLARAPSDLSPVLQAMCAEGVLLRIRAESARSNEWTYAATKAWLGEPLAEADRAESLVWLAGDYLTAYGPATIDDFAWWAGVSRAEATAAFAPLEPADLGSGLKIHRRDERAFAQTRPMANRVNLLPKWDCYTMGYAEGSRDRFVAPRLRKVMYDTGGNALAVVLVEGEVQGLWDVRHGKTSATVRLQMFDKPGPALRAALDAEAALVGTLFDAETTAVEFDKAPKRAPAKAKAKPKPKPKARSKPKPKAKAATKPSRPGSSPRRTVSKQDR